MKSIRDLFHEQADAAEREAQKSEIGAVEAFLDAIDSINREGFLRVEVDMQLGEGEQIFDARSFQLTVADQFKDRHTVMEMDFDDIFEPFCTDCQNDRTAAAAYFVRDIAARAGRALAIVTAHQRVAERLGQLRPKP